MHYFFKIVLFSFLWTCSFSANTQIVNIERARMQSDTLGWLGSAGADIALNKNTQSVFASNADVHVQYKSPKSLYLVLANYGFLKGESKKFIDYAFAHIRYNYKMNKTLRWEIFTQIQNNVVTKIKSRYLLGTGPRFKIIANKKWRMYAAALMMWEQEKEIGLVPLHRDIRNSSYVSFTYTPNPIVEVISTSFYQPIVKNFRDFRFLHQTSLKLKTGKHFSIHLHYNYLMDAFPAAGIPTVNYTLTSGFGYEF